MENLRWILIFAGVAILALLYFSGRGGKGASGSRSRTGHVRRDEFEFDGDVDTADPLLGQGNADGYESLGYEEFPAVDPADLERPGGAVGARSGARSGATGGSLDGELGHELSPAEPVASHPDPFEMDRAAASQARSPASSPSGLGGLTQKIDAIGAKLSGKRRQRVAESRSLEDVSTEPVYASKIITLHVVGSAPGAPDRHLDGQALLSAFEQRGYTFGEMNIFHSMHNGKTVFSVAKMVEPGWFDPEDINSFSTPGITLILQLPGPVAADTAFEVLLSEAFDIAEELGGTVLDGDRSTLSKQTAQHMREGIYEYMHRQKYFGSVAT